MLTNEFCSRALNQAQGFKRASDLVPLLNDTQNMLYKHECSQTLYRDPSTGQPPMLQTQAALMRYDSSSTGNSWLANVWRVANILLKNPGSGDYGSLTQNINTTEYITINGKRYYPYPFIGSEDALEGASPAGPLIDFSEDPGAATSKYYAQAYKLPARQIASDRIQLSIPDSNGAHRRIVFPCFMKLIEAQNDGNYDEAVQYIDTKKDELWSILSKGAQGKRHRVRPRPY